MQINTQLTFYGSAPENNSKILEVFIGHYNENDHFYKMKQI